VSLIESNPLRVLDCKVCAPVLSDAPAMKDHLCDACADHYAGVKASLDRLDLPYTEDGRLVRGLDYYTRTAFEYIATDLATAQNAVGGGGRYDGLAESIGGRRTPGVGFALGIDRIVLSSSRAPSPPVDVFVISETNPSDALVASSVLRSKGLRVDFDTEGRSVKAQFKVASRSAAPARVIVSDSSGPVGVRFGDDNIDLPIGEVAEWLMQRLR
jgi:histidyl-tRNA synthetase